MAAAVGETSGAVAIRIEGRGPAKAADESKTEETSSKNAERLTLLNKQHSGDVNGEKKTAGRISKVERRMKKRQTEKTV